MSRPALKEFKKKALSKAAVNKGYQAVAPAYALRKKLIVVSHFNQSSLSLCHLSHVECFFLKYFSAEKTPALFCSDIQARLSDKAYSLDRTLD
jgi:hypothetical protein